MIFYGISVTYKSVFVTENHIVLYKGGIGMKRVVDLSSRILIKCAKKKREMKRPTKMKTEKMTAKRNYGKKQKKRESSNLRKTITVEYFFEYSFYCNDSSRMKNGTKPFDRCRHVIPREHSANRSQAKRYRKDFIKAKKIDEVASPSWAKERCRKFSRVTRREVTIIEETI